MLKPFIIPILVIFSVFIPMNAFAESASMVYRISLTLPERVNTAAAPNTSIANVNRKSPTQLVQTQNVVRAGREVLLQTIVVL